MAVNRAEFLEMVESGQRTVYPEDSPSKVGRALTPVVKVGILLAVGIYSLTFLFALSIIGDFDPSFISTFMFLATTGVATVPTCLHASKRTRKKSTYGIRGISRTRLSRAIFFLDILENGHMEVGKIKGPSVPEETGANMTHAHGAAIYALSRIDRGLANTWRTTLKETLAPETPRRAIWLLKVTVFGIVMVFPFIAIVMIFAVLGVLSGSIAFQIMWASFGVMFVFLIVLFLDFAWSSHHRNVPERVLAAVTEPQVRFDTEQALEKLVEVYKEEGKYPLRVLVFDNREAFVYTDLVYETTKGYMLRAAALFPNQTTSDLADDQWTD